MSSGLLVIPGVSTRYSRCVYLALSTLDVVIKDYYFEVLPRLACSSLSLLCAPWQKTRPNSKASSLHLVLFLFVFFKCFFCSWFLSLAASESARREPPSRRSREFTPPFAALPSRGSRESTPPFAALPSRGSREFTPPFAALPSRGSRESTPPFAALPSRGSRDFTPPFAAQPSRRSREFTPPFADQPALSSLEMTPPSTANPSPPACLWLNARRPASDSMPAGLPLIPARQECRWLKLAGLPLTQARRICRWPHATGRWQGSQFTSAVHAAVCGLTDPTVRGRSRRRPWGKPTHRRRLPLVSRESQPAVRGFTRPAAGWGSLQPAGPCRCVVKPAGCCRYLSSQPIMVSPAGRCRIDKPAGRGRIWPVSDHGLFNCFCEFSPGGLLIPLSFPKEILGGGSRAPAEETEVGAGAAVSEAVPPWPPELPAPPWPPELPAPPWPPELPAPPWPPELPAPPGPRSVCSTLEAPSCGMYLCRSVGSPECPPPLPGSTVTARDVPSGRGELC